MCNVAKRLIDYSSDTVHFYTNEGSLIVVIPNGTADDTEIQVVYPLATPIEYQLTPQQVTTLIGTNNVWSDANGNTEVSYWTH